METGCDHRHPLMAPMARDDISTRTMGSQPGSLLRFAEAVELYDPLTAGHSRRVGANGRILADALGLNDDEQDVVYWAGLLHDVGKIAVPASILRKPGPLTGEERALMRKHPGLGASLIRESPAGSDVMAAAVGAHHERWDGLGYPKGLAGEAIPLYGRILAVVDVFEALTAERPYRSPLEPAEALAFIRDGAGSAFDPELIAQFDLLVRRDAITVAPTAAANRRAACAGGALAPTVPAVPTVSTTAVPLPATAAMVAAAAIAAMERTASTAAVAMD